MPKVIVKKPKVIVKKPKVVVKKPKVVVKKYKRQNKKTKGGGDEDEIKELRYRLGVHLEKLSGMSHEQHLQDCDMIIQKLKLTDRGSVVHTDRGKLVDKILKYKDNELNQSVRRIVAAIISLQKEILEGEEELIKPFNEITICSGSTGSTGSTGGMNVDFNTILTSLKLTNKYEIIVLTTKVIEDIRREYHYIQNINNFISCLNSKKIELEEKYKVFTLLMKTNLLTLYEAKNVANILKKNFKIIDPADIIYCSEGYIDSIDSKILSEKKQRLWKWIQSYKLHLLKPKLNDNFSNDITKRIIIGIKKYLKKNTGRDIYGDFHTLFRNSINSIPDYLKTLNPNIKNIYGLIKLDLTSIVDEIIRKDVANIQGYYKEDKEYILNIIEKAELLAGRDYSSSKSSSSKSSSSRFIRRRFRRRRFIIEKAELLAGRDYSSSKS